MQLVNARATRALIVNLGSVEEIDVSEHLTALGWDPSVVVQTVDLALRQLAMFERTACSFSLAILGLSASSPGLGPFLDMCAEQAIPILYLNGETKLATSDHVTTLARPFSATDLDAALDTLGLLGLNGHGT